MIEFRKEMGVKENIYVLNYSENKSIKREKGVIVALFVDLGGA